MLIFNEERLKTIVCSVGDHDEDFGSGVAVVKKAKTKLPKKYKVLLHNDDYTTMEFVVIVLQKFFNKNSEEATAIMLQVHNDGAGVCGVYTYEIAETKSSQVLKFARDNGHPLKCTIEAE